MPRPMIIMIEKGNKMYMYKTMAIIAALMATPAMAEFKQMPIAGYCTDKFSDFETTFGEFDAVEFSKPNGNGVAHVYMENERYTFTGIALPSSVVCVVWSHDKGEGA